MISRMLLSLVVLMFLSYPLSAMERAADAEMLKQKSIALIIDASGSMQARLKNGDRRIDAAKDAVARLLQGTGDKVRLALRAYGHQSPRARKNCRDTELLTGFSPVGVNRDQVIEKARGLNAQGYTPISLVLEKAAKDLGAEKEAGARVVVLVSDGKETCEGDPCAVVKALAAADAELVVHTIGFAVDVAARYQLQCIAKYGRGTYFEADDAERLAEKLSTAVKTVSIAAPQEIKSASLKPGTLRLMNPSASRHPVFNAETNKEVGMLSAVTPAIALPAGFYQVKFGNTLWRSIEVKDGEETAIETAILQLPNASFKGHAVLDWETGEAVGKLSSMANTMNVIPSSFQVMFGEKPVRVELKPGEVLVIEAGSVKFSGLPINSRSIYDDKGVEVMTVSALYSSATLPPGKYELAHNDTRTSFTIEAAMKKAVVLKKK